MKHRGPHVGVGGRRPVAGPQSTSEQIRKRYPFLKGLYCPKTVKINTILLCEYTFQRWAACDQPHKGPEGRGAWTPSQVCISPGSQPASSGSTSSCP